MFKRANKRPFHEISSKQLDRHLEEFAGRYNMREPDAIDQLRSLRSGMDGKRLTRKALIRANRHVSGAGVATST